MELEGVPKSFSSHSIRFTAIVSIEEHVSTFDVFTQAQQDGRVGKVTTWGSIKFNVEIVSFVEVEARDINRQIPSVFCLSSAKIDR